MAIPYFNDPAMGWNATPADPYTPTQLPGVLSGQTSSIGHVQGPLSGSGGGGFLSGLRGLLDPQYALPIAAQLIGGATPQASFAGALSMAGPAIGDIRKRAAINAYLKSQSGLNLTPEEQQLLRADPELAQSVVAGHLAPHPSQLTYNPVTGAAGKFEPFGGQYTPLPEASVGGASAAGTDAAANGMPAGFIVRGASPIKDDSAGRSGLVDVTGKIWWTGAAVPNADQSQASGAAALARKANELIKANEEGQGRLAASVERQGMQVPILGPMISGPKGRGFDTGKKQFMSAIRALAIQAKINPDSATQGYTEDALFAAQGDTPEDITQKQGIREQIIKNLEQRAGSFVQQPAAEAPAAPATPAGGIPIQPSSVPAGSAWSPSRHMWRSPDGAHMFDAQGNLVQ